MSDEKIEPPKEPRGGVTMSAETEKAWLAEECAYTWMKIARMEDRAKELTKEHNAWMQHVANCNRTNTVTASAFVVLAVTLIVLAVFVIKSLPI